MSERKRGNILVVDDDPGMREFLVFALTSEGYTVVSAANGDEALAHVRKRSQEKEAGAEIDLTIMDIKMPPPGGIEVLRQLREADPDAVVILNTGYASLETAIQAVRYGAYDYLTKPLTDVSELLTIVQRGFARRRLLASNRLLLTQLRQAYEENLRLLEEMQAMNRELESRVAERTWELEKANRRLKELDLLRALASDGETSGLERADRRLEELDRLKSELLANISHELYTPLNAIVGFSQALMDGLHGMLSASQARLVESIQDSGLRLRSSFDDLIDMARLSASEVTIHPRSVPLAPMLQGTRDRVEQSAQEKEVEIAIEIAPHLRVVWADEAKLKRMLYELLSNAVRFTRTRGRVTLQAMLHPPDQPHELHLAVSDTGVGIPADKLEVIFDPFQQVDSSLSRRFGGLGLGLAIVRHYAELHGGRVWAESEPGSGSTFTLALPLMPAPAD